MKYIQKVYRKIIDIFMKLITMIKIIIQSIIYKNKIYLFGAPFYGNLGDHAILLAQEKFLQDNYIDKNVKIIEVELSLILKYGKILKLIVKNSNIFVIGGGFLGSLWMEGEEMFRKTIQLFPNNKIIMFPQTVYFSNDEEGKNILKDSIDIYSKHKNLFICCREKYSYEFMKENFPNCNIILVPDIVLYLDSINNNISRDGVLFCIRKDKEKMPYDFDRVKEILKRYEINKIDYTDTVIPQSIYINRRKKINSKLNEFSQYKLIITDRLHGMIFSVLAKTPCLALENKSYKVKGVYEWIKHLDYIKLYDEQNVEKQIAELLENQNVSYNNTDIIKKYEPLVNLIKK